VAQLLT
jgi:hypothetical protein